MYVQDNVLAALGHVSNPEKQDEPIWQQPQLVTCDFFSFYKCKSINKWNFDVENKQGCGHGRAG